MDFNSVKSFEIAVFSRWNLKKERKSDNYNRSYEQNIIMKSSKAI